MSNPSAMTHEQIATELLRTNQIELNGTATTGIQTRENALSKDINPMDLITRGALDLLLQEVNHLIQSIDPTGVTLEDMALITRSTVDPYFECEKDWILSNWFIADNLLCCRQAENSFAISNSGFPSKGKYLLCINVDRLPSGHIEVTKNGEWLFTISQPGTTYRELTIDNVAHDEIRFTVIGLNTEDTAVIFSLSVHHIAERLYGYLVSKIRELATVNADEYMTRDEVAYSLGEFTKQFQQATQLYLQNLLAHEKATNPHSITPDGIKAAHAEHSHSQYLTKNELAEAVDERMSSFAKIGHVHEQYLTMESAKTLVISALKEHMYSSVAVAPAIVTKGPVGILPGQFAQMDLSTPTTILQPTIVDHNPYTSYDHLAGIVTTNCAELLKEVPKIFCTDLDVCGTIGTPKYPINFRLMYHTYRDIGGYRIRCRRGFPTDWSIFVGDTTYIHRLSADRSKYKEDGDWLVFDVYFEKVEEASLFTILIESMEMLDSTMDLKIEILYEDFEDNQTFGITNEAFQFSVPVSGNTRLVNIPKTVNKTPIKPDVCQEGVPVYVFGAKDTEDIEAQFDYSYIPPEYGLVRKGLDVLADKFNGLIRESIPGKETYIHSAYGMLALEEGYSAADSHLTNLFNTDKGYWISDGQTNRVSVTFLVQSDNVVLTGYSMEWTKDIEQYIPDTWSLTITGYTADGKERHVALDSVQQYYPVYSVEDDDIIYYKAFDTALTVKKITLTMTRVTEGVTRIAMNRLRLYLSEHFYSIPANTMYCGVKERSAICLGTAHYHNDRGWDVTNMPIGRSCVSAVNNLKATEANHTYTVTNPFHSADVSVDIHNYNLIEGAAKDTPLAYITKITADTIEMVSEHSYQYALAIHRKW